MGRGMLNQEHDGWKGEGWTMRRESGWGPEKTRVRWRAGWRLLVILAVVGGLWLAAGLETASAQGTLGQRVLKAGMWGEDVFELQRLLIRVGFEQPVTGNYGETTMSHVRSLQRYGGLAVDGEAGPATIAFLRQMGERPRYRVRSGDTLYDLSLRFGVSMTHLVDVNLLSSTMLRPGQELVVPDYWIYSVRRGETLSGLARRFGVPVERLRSANLLAPGAVLNVGDGLWIPLPDW